MTSIEQLLDSFWANYPQTPSEHEKKSLIEWALSLNDIEALTWALDSKNHPRQSTGSIPKPNLATLKSLSYEFRIERNAGENQRLDALATENGCFYCSNGFVYMVIKGSYWSPTVIGRCEHCKDGEKGSAWLRPKEPPAYIIEFARQHDVDCYGAVRLMIELHEKQLKEKPNIESEVPF